MKKFSMEQYKKELAEQGRKERELAKPAIQLAKKLKLPFGSGMKVRSGGYYWQKSGGYFKKFADIERASKAAGFSPKESEATGSPDGNYMRGRVILVRADGWELSWSRSYGVVKSDNWFQIELKKVQK